MPLSADCVSLLSCPDCHASLAHNLPGAEGEAEELTCSACHAIYPVQGGVPWLYRDVSGSRAQWAGKLQRFRSELLAERAEVAAASLTEDLVDSTKARLARYLEGLDRFGEEVFELLAPFGLTHSEAGAKIPRDRVPSAQHVTSYLETAFRDWCWGEAEIRETMSLVEPLLGETKASRVLVLGGGAGRFAWELSQQLPEADIVQLDLNPLLTRIACLVASGESVDLTELPRFPVSVEDAVVHQRLLRPEGLGSISPLYVLGDAFAPPFAPGSFDLLVTPWFLDIVPEAFSSLSRRLGGLLREAGRWVSFGPLSFESLSIADRHTPEEMADLLEVAGFEIDAAGTETVSYLHSPHGMARRGEELFAFAATRKGVIPEPDAFSFYPDWLIDDKVAIPLEERFETERAEKTFEVEILKCIDGRASIEDLVIILSSRYSLPPDRCRSTILHFFAKWIEGTPSNER